MKREPMEATQAQEAPTPKLRAIRGEELRRGEEVRNVYRLTLRADIPYQALLGHEAGHLVGPIAGFLTIGDKLEVLGESGDFYAELLLVEHVPGRTAQFIEIVRKDLNGRPVDDRKGTGQFRSAWLGWVHRYGVVSPEGGVTQQDILTEQQANAEAHRRNAPSFARSTFV